MIRFALLLCILTASMLIPPNGTAHDLVSLNGQAMDHGHVERSGPYGTTPQQGHFAKPAGSANGILIFSASRPNSFGNLVPIEDVGHAPRQSGTLHQQFQADMARHRVGANGSQ